MELYENAFQIGGIWKRQFFGFRMNLKQFENNVVTVIT